MFQKQASIQTRAGSCKEEIAGILIFRGYVEGLLLPWVVSKNALALWSFINVTWNLTNFTESMHSIHSAPLKNQTFNYFKHS